jgi:CheY-like chemotaxis protein
MKRLSGAAVARQQLFTLADGNFVVQWEEKQVQELLTGRYRPYDHKKDFGHPITDYELGQLKSAGRVEHHTRTYVWLYALPEKGRFGPAKTMDRGDRIRVYYLTSTLPKSQLTNVQSLLTNLQLGEEFLARSRNGLIVVLGKNGLPFRHLKDAEKAQKLLEAKSPDMFAQLAVAFVETKAELSQQATGDVDSELPDLSLQEIIASQGDTLATEGKCIVLAVKQEEERQEFTSLFIEKMRLRVQQANSGIEAIQLSEDSNPDLLVTDSTLPDMHVWQLMGKLKEIGNLRDLPLIVITDEPTFGANVAQVDYLTRPVAISRLRHSVWTVLNAKIKNPLPPSS